MAYRIYTNPNKANYFIIQSFDGANAGGEDTYDSLSFVAEASGDEDINIVERVPENPVNTIPLGGRKILIRAIPYSAITDENDASVGADQSEVLAYLNSIIGVVSSVPSSSIANSVVYPVDSSTFSGLNGTFSDKHLVRTDENGSNIYNRIFTGTAPGGSNIASEDFLAIDIDTAGVNSINCDATKPVEFDVVDNISTDTLNLRVLVRRVELSGTDIVRIRFYNPTGGAIDISGEIFTFRLFYQEV